MKNKALDYLLKPVDALHVRQTIKRFMVNHSKSEYENRLKSLINMINRTERLIIPTITGLKNINVTEIFYLQKEKSTIENIKVFYSENVFDTIPGCYTLKQNMEMLNGHDFF